MQLIYRVIFCLSMLFTSLVVQAIDGVNTDPYYNYNQESNFEKLYLEPEQVIISKNGIFLKIADTFYQSPELYSDDAGIYIPIHYVVTRHEKCDYGHLIICKRCGGCAGCVCPFRCHCK
jgi:hypothetical protein